MNDERRKVVDRIFDESVLLAGAERDRRVNELCGGDRSLSEEVRQLLAAHDRAGGILDAPLIRGDSPLFSAQAATPLASDVASGTVPAATESSRHIGPYRIVREIGRGGMGVVYLAERDDGQFRRRVAIKLLRASPDAEELQRRFMEERQILASLDHPNIAQLLDGGVTDGQLPYLVMEYVDGLPITVYCERERLDIAERLRLFLDVCAAVSHAHQNLVIHRDLKPGNILVTVEGRVKLLDFGIAKLLNPSYSSGYAPVTRTEYRVLTPEYASPEQIRGDPLGTSSDTYSLGVVLYELLCGRRPHGETASSPAGLAADITDREPQKPSDAVMEIARPARDRGTDADSSALFGGVSREKVRRRLRGDLDAIVMFALRKEQRKRYASAEALAHDIRRHLEGEPVRAHRGGRMYRLSRFARRHRRTVVAAALTGVSLLGGAGFSFYQGRVAAAQRDRAEAALAETEMAMSVLTEILSGADPLIADSDSLTVTALLRRGASRLEQNTAYPAAQARALTTIGNVFDRMGELDEAEPLLQRAVSMLDALPGQEQALAQSMVYLASVRAQRGSHDESDSLLQAALRLQERSIGRKHPDVALTLHELGRLNSNNGELAARLYNEALEIRLAALGPDHPDVGTMHNAIAMLMRRHGNVEAAERHLRTSLDIVRRSEGEESPRVAASLTLLADMLRGDKGELDSAKALYLRALDIQRRHLGARHPRVSYSLSGLAVVAADAREYALADSLLREAHEIRRRAYGEDNPRTWDALSMLARVLQQQGRYAEAERIQRDLLSRARRAYAEYPTRVALALAEAGELFAAVGKTGEARSMFEEALNMLEEGDGRSGPVAERVQRGISRLGGGR